MTTFREALKDAAVLWVPGQSIADRIDNALGFLKALEASGFKIIGPEVTARMQVAGGDDMEHESLRMACDQWARFVYLFKRAVSNAPSVTDLLAEEQP
jgi:hypothetical protein